MKADCQRGPRALWCVTLGVALAIAPGCGESDEGDDPTATPTAATTPTPTPEVTPTPTPEPIAIEGCDWVISPSADDQEAAQSALIDAQEGETVCFTEGVFSFYSELSLSVNEVTLKGAGQGLTILDFSEQISGGNGIAVTGDNIVVQDFTVLNTPGDGIRATDVDGITYLRVSVIWEDDASEDNGAYGLYPVGCNRVTIQECYVKGASDAGVYVGQSQNILVIDNEAEGNVAGIEIENSTDAEVAGNYSHGNTGGVLVFNLPDLPIMDGKRSKVHSNTIEANNTINFAPEGNIVGIVPQGTGILILATDSNEFHNNVIKDNQSVGITILSYSEVLVGTYDDPDFDPYPEGNYIHDNEFVNNGYDPQGTAAVVLAAVNAAIVQNEGAGAVQRVTPPYLWDGCENAELAGQEEQVNCANRNTDDSDADYFYANFAVCGETPFQEYSLDESEVTCDHTPLESITF